MDIIRLPFYIVLYAWRFSVSACRWIACAFIWIGIFAAIGGVFYGISYVAESYLPATIIYSVIGAGAFLRWKMDRS